MIELVVRLVFSLAVVLGMLLLLTRFSAKRFKGGTDALIRVLHRQPLSRTSAVAVVAVGSRVLVVGTTEHQVQLLVELDADEIEDLVAASPSVTSPSAAVPGAAHVTAPVAASVAASPAPEDVEPPEVWELATLDELLGFPAEVPVDVVDAPYTPGHPDGSDVATPSARPVRTARPAVAGGALAGSLLSAQTWKQAFAAATNRPRDAS